MSINKSDLVRRLFQDNPHLDRRDTERVVNKVFDEIAAALVHGDRVEVRGFGCYLSSAAMPS